MFFLKKKRNQESLNDDIQVLQSLKRNNRYFRELYGRANKYPLANNLKQICIISDKILKEVSLNQNKIAKVNTFNNYYVPTTIKLLEQYIDIKEYKVVSNENEKIIDNIENVLLDIRKAFEALFNQLINDDNKDIDVEIRVLIKELKKWE